MIDTAETDAQMSEEQQAVGEMDVVARVSARIPCKILFVIMGGGIVVRDKRKVGRLLALPFAEVFNTACEAYGEMVVQMVAHKQIGRKKVGEIAFIFLQ